MAPKAKPAAKPANVEAKVKAEKKEKKEDRPEDLIPKVPEPDPAVFDEKIAKVQEDIDAVQVKQQELSKRIGERSGGKDEFMTERNRIRAELDKWSKAIDDVRARKEELQQKMGVARQENISMKDEFKKMQKSIGYNTEVEIDDRIRQLEFRRTTESISLKEEKEILKEMSELKKNRPKVAQVKQLGEKVSAAGGGTNLKETLGEINAEMSRYFDEKKKWSEEWKALSEKRKETQGDLPALIAERDAFGEKIRGLITDRNKIKADRRQAEQEFYAYKNEIRKLKQERASKERDERQKDFELRKRQRDAEKLDDVPHIGEMQLVEQTILFCKSLTASKGPVEKAEKKEITHDLPKDAEVLIKKEDREEEFFFAPTAKSKKGKSKGPKTEGSSSKPIKHNAETFQLFDKLKLDAPLNTDAIPALLETLEAKLEEYKEKVKKWEDEREDLKRKILEGEVTVDEIAKVEATKGSEDKVDAEETKEQAKSEEVVKGDETKGSDEDAES